MATRHSHHPRGPILNTERHSATRKTTSLSDFQGGNWSSTLRAGRACSETKVRRRSSSRWSSARSWTSDAVSHFRSARATRSHGWVEGATRGLVTNASAGGRGFICPVSSTPRPGASPTRHSHHFGPAMRSELPFAAPWGTPSSTHGAHGRSRPNDHLSGRSRIGINTASR